MKPGQRWWVAALGCAWAAGLAGCGTPGAPQPPSLHLPQPVSDLSATRVGDRVTLTWTMPKRTTDHVALKADVVVGVCRKEGAAACVDAGTRKAAPGATARFAETLPAELGAGAPRGLAYFVELRNSRGRSAGLSNAAVVVAGAAPAAVTGFAAEARKAGVVVRWQANGETAAVRLERTRLTARAPKKKGAEALSADEEPAVETLLIDDVHAGQALDKTAQVGETYRYRAQRVARVSVEGRRFELLGAWSEPVEIAVEDVFAPAVPQGLAAVATAGTETAIDLSWEPVSDVGLAGYVVYRREGDAVWQRVSPKEPVEGPAYHDAAVEPGHSYRYAVSAVGRNGKESARSAEAQETVPAR